MQRSSKRKTSKHKKTREQHRATSIPKKLIDQHIIVSDSSPTAPRQLAQVLKHSDGLKRKSIMKLDYALWQGDVETFLGGLPLEPLFDLIVTSPPYNIGKAYETRNELEKYIGWQERVIDKLIPRLKKGGSVCWQVGNYVNENQIFPLDIEFAPLFKKHKLQLRNRIIWHFGHGLHTQRRFSGRYEVVLWYTNTHSKKDTYTFNLDPVRVASKYPGKKHFKGPNAGKLSGNPLGKNPEDFWITPHVQRNQGDKSFEDVWNIPNVKCQSALEWDPLSASKRDPFERRVLPVALAPSELAGVAETARARACA